MEALFELAIRVFSDGLYQEKAQNIVVFAHTQDNFNYALIRSVEIYQQLNIPVIIHGAGNISGYVGADEYKKELHNQGVKKEDIKIAEPIDMEMLHTRNESIAYIRFLKNQNFTNSLIISTPFHQLRAFMTMVSIAIEENVQIKLYNCPVLNFNWYKSIIHSQGKLKEIAYNLIHEELARISKYQAKGDLKTTKEILNYLNSRDLNFGKSEG